MGKTHARTSVAIAPDGSPPRLWGKHHACAFYRKFQRFTPTPVGKTRPSRPPGSPAAGSPPRLWGKQLQSVFDHARLRFTPTPVGKTPTITVGNAFGRFTPTPVGKTSACSASLAIRSVHPHACGENAGQRFVFAQNNRFTPTPVGKTKVHNSGSMVIKVHPHACGENDKLTREVETLRGSPPRLWGKHRHQSENRRLYRFTPTPVGKTTSSLDYAQENTVHPHACGENARAGACPRLGSRFTPTPVGKTNSPRTKRPRVPVHPHACGENALPFARNRRLRGSPPRLWGKREIRETTSQAIRFTPTPVGKTP